VLSISQAEKVLGALSLSGLLGPAGLTYHEGPCYKVSGPGTLRYVKEEGAKMMCQGMPDRTATLMTTERYSVGWRDNGLNFYIGTAKDISEAVDRLKDLDPEELPRLAAMHASWDHHTCERFPLIQALAVLRLDGTI